VNKTTVVPSHAVWSARQEKTPVQYKSRRQRSRSATRQQRIEWRAPRGRYRVAGGEQSLKPLVQDEWGGKRARDAEQ
jgi:hypothetical protein